MQREKGKVSVIVTNYNRAPYIRECLDSLWRQTYPHLEIILIDDASTDHSLEVIEQWREEHSLRSAKPQEGKGAVQNGEGTQSQKVFDVQPARTAEELLTVVRLPRNMGFSGAMTTGLFMARGEFIAIQDADDWSHEARLERQVAFLDLNPHMDLVGTNYASFREGGERVLTPAKWLKYGKDIRSVYWNGGHCICHGTIMFRGSVFDRIGGLTRRITGAEDYEFIVKFLDAKSQIDNLPDILYYYRQHEEQRSTAFFGK